MLACDRKAFSFCHLLYPLSQCCKYHNDEYTTILSQDIQVCRKCGVIFDLNIRQNKDCPLCSAGEHTKLRMNDVSDSK